MALVSSAAVVDVAALVRLASHRAAAVPTADQPGEGEAVAAALGSAGATVVEHVLDLLVQLFRHDRLVVAAIGATLPREVAGVGAVAKDLVDGWSWDRNAALTEAEAGLSGLARDVLQRVVAAGVPLEELSDQGRPFG